ncbi:MAG: aldo/keto reductase [Chloroflexi bacterium]|nr:aldo/keto reductase [Chloroflexota bacterium]
MTMTRNIPGIGMPISAVGMGCWAIGGPFQYLDVQAGWGEVDDNESIRAIHAALDNGINLFDTAANYGTGHSETVLGKALKGKRDQAIIATKFGFQVDYDRKLVLMYATLEETIQNVRAECENSLRRLGVETIDLYQLHVNEYPAEYAVKLRDELEKLVQEGKIRTYGWSTDFVDAARAFIDGGHCAAIQYDLNVVHDAPNMIALCEEKAVAGLIRTPLARSALTGKYNPQSTFTANDVRSDQWTQDTFLKPAYNRLGDLRDILTSEGRTLAQGALAWIWARSETTIPIPGIRTIKQAQENAQAMQFGPLKPEQMQEIDDILGRVYV